MHPYGVERLAASRLAELAAEAERSRLARIGRWRPRARRGLRMPDRIGRRIDRRGLRDIVI